jgi:hypothetical protein
LECLGIESHPDSTRIARDQHLAQSGERLLKIHHLAQIMLPDPPHMPSEFAQLAPSLSIPLFVVGDLLSPPRIAVLLEVMASPASVPEAAVNEYGDFGAGEDYVRIAG